MGGPNRGPMNYLASYRNITSRSLGGRRGGGGGKIIPCRTTSFSSQLVVRRAHSYPISCVRCATE